LPGFSMIVPKNSLLAHGLKGQFGEQNEGSAH
jgi:hypothetical protein